jgi:hypothetical protein
MRSKSKNEKKAMIDKEWIAKKVVSMVIKE